MDEQARPKSGRSRLPQTCLAAVFCGAISLAFPVFNIFSRQLSLDNHENRLLTTLPTVLASPLEELPNALNTFFADNSPWRYQLVQANAALNYHVFGVVESDQVILGKEGWLFYKDGPSPAQPLANYQGLVRLREDEMARLAANLQALSDALAAEGGTLVVSFAPSKDLVYPEYVPDIYPRLSEEDVTAQLAGYLAVHTTVPICYELQDYAAAKPHGQLFFKTDTHWNHRGAIIALNEVFDALGLAHGRFVDYDFKASGLQTGDMANVAALYDILPEEEDFYPANYTGEVDKRTVTMFGDSFSEYYMRYLNDRFVNAWRVALADLDLSTLPTSGSDIVILEANERSFDTLQRVLDPK